MSYKGRTWTPDISFRNLVAANIEGVVKRAEIMACKIERDQVCLMLRSYKYMKSDVRRSYKTQLTCQPRRLCKL